MRYGARRGKSRTPIAEAAMLSAAAPNVALNCPEVTTPAAVPSPSTTKLNSPI